MRGLRASTTLLVLVLVLVCAACGRSTTDVDEPGVGDGMRVASFDFAESELLAELYAQVLDAAGVPVIRLGVVGPREIVAPSLELDRIDLVPEYLGTASRFFGDTNDSADVDSTQASTGGLQRLLTPRGLVALDAAAAQNSNAIVVTSEFAREGDIVTIGDLASRAPTLRFGGPVECPDRPLCLLGLVEVYGVAVADCVPQRSVALTAVAAIGPSPIGSASAAPAPPGTATGIVRVSSDIASTSHSAPSIARPEITAREGPKVHCQDPVCRSVRVSRG